MSVQPQLQTRSNSLPGALPLMPALSLTQYHRKISAAKREPLLNSSCHRNASIASRHPVTLAEDPHAPGVVLKLKNASAQRSKRIAYTSPDSDFFARKP